MCIKTEKSDKNHVGTLIMRILGKNNKILEIDTIFFLILTIDLLNWIFFEPNSSWGIHQILFHLIFFMCISFLGKLKGYVRKCQYNVLNKKVQYHLFTHVHYQITKVSISKSLLIQKSTLFQRKEKSLQFYVPIYTIKTKLYLNCTLRKLWVTFSVSVKWANSIPLYLCKFYELITRLCCAQ